MTRKASGHHTRATTIFALALISVLAFSYGLQKQIEITQQSFEIDYN